MTRFLGIKGHKSAKFIVAVNIKEIQDIPLGLGDVALEWNFQHHSHEDPMDLIPMYPDIQLYKGKIESKEEKTETEKNGDHETSGRTSPISSIRTTDTRRSGKGGRSIFNVGENENRSKEIYENLVKHSSKKGTTEWRPLENYKVITNTLLLNVVDIPLSMKSTRDVILPISICERNDTNDDIGFLQRSESKLSRVMSDVANGLHMEGGNRSSRLWNMGGRMFSGNDSKRYPPSEGEDEDFDASGTPTLQRSSLRLSIYWLQKGSDKRSLMGTVNIDLSQFAANNTSKSREDDVPIEGTSWRFLMNKSRLNSLIRVRIQLWCVQTPDGDSVGGPPLRDGLYKSSRFRHHACGDSINSKLDLNNAFSSKRQENSHNTSKNDDDDDDDAYDNAEQLNPHVRGSCKLGDDRWSPSFPSNYPILPGYNDPSSIILCQAPAIALVDALFKNAENGTEEDDWTQLANAKTDFNAVLCQPRHRTPKKEEPKNGNNKHNAARKFKAVVDTTRAVQRLKRLPHHLAEASAA